MISMDGAISLSIMIRMIRLYINNVLHKLILFVLCNRKQHGEISVRETSIKNVHMNEYVVVFDILSQIMIEKK